MVGLERDAIFDTPFFFRTKECLSPATASDSATTVAIARENRIVEQVIRFLGCLDNRECLVDMYVLLNELFCVRRCHSVLLEKIELMMDSMNSFASTWPTIEQRLREYDGSISFMDFNDN